MTCHATLAQVDSDPKGVVLPTGTGKVTITLTIKSHEKFMNSTKFMLAVGPVGSSSQGLEPVFCKKPFTCVYGAALLLLH